MIRRLAPEFAVAGFSLQVLLGRDDGTIDVTTADDADRETDVANLTVASTFLGQFLSDRPFSAALAFAGFGVWTALAVLTFVLAGND